MNRATRVPRLLVDEPAIGGLGVLEACRPARDSPRARAPASAPARSCGASRTRRRRSHRPRARASRARRGPSRSPRDWRGAIPRAARRARPAETAARAPSSTAAARGSAEIPASKSASRGSPKCARTRSDATRRHPRGSQSKSSARTRPGSVRAASARDRLSTSQPSAASSPIDSACSGERQLASRASRRRMRPGAVAAQVGRRIRAAEQRREIGLGRQVQVDRARLRACVEQRPGEPPGAARRLDDDRARRSRSRGSTAAASCRGAPANCVTLRSDSGRTSTSRASAIDPQRQRLAQRQHGGRLVEQPAQERRADMTGVEDEMQRPRIRDLPRSLRDGGTRKPGALQSPGRGSGRRGNSPPGTRAHRYG